MCHSICSEYLLVLQLECECVYIKHSYKAYAHWHVWSSKIWAYMLLAVLILCFGVLFKLKVAKKKKWNNICNVHRSGYPLSSSQYPFAVLFTIGFLRACILCIWTIVALFRCCALTFFLVFSVENPTIQMTTKNTQTPPKNDSTCHIHINGSYQKSIHQLIRANSNMIINLGETIQNL